MLYKYIYIYIFFFFTLIKCPSIHNFFKKYNVLLFILFNRDMMVNLYNLYFQPNKKVFYPFTFPSSQSNTNEGN